MKKIPTLFGRDFVNKARITKDVTPGCEWVLIGEGIATRKLDGTCCMIREGVLYKRREIKLGQDFPKGFESAGPPDPVTGKIVGWMRTDTTDKWHLEALENQPFLPDGTYELMGPKIQCNPDLLDFHRLVKHGQDVLHDVPRTYAGLKEYLIGRPNMEGIVFHHSDGRMVKIKRKDFLA
jgi:hypothetical protein